MRALSSEIFLRIYDIEGALGSILGIDSLYCEARSYIEIIRKSFMNILSLGKIFGFDHFNRKIIFVDIFILLL